MVVNGVFIVVLPLNLFSQSSVLNITEIRNKGKRKMELEKGLCFCCTSNKILVHNKPEVCEKLFIQLFGEAGFTEV